MERLIYSCRDTSPIDQIELNFEFSRLRADDRHAQDVQMSRRRRCRLFWCRWYLGIVSLSIVLLFIIVVIEGAWA